jgi:hypothetical protein
MSDDPKITALTIQLAVLYGGGITGLASLILAFFPFVNGDFLSAGISLSFGLMANAVLREGLLR